MIRKYVLPILAVFGVLFAVYTVVSGSRPTVPALPVTQPSVAPFSRYIAGAGIIEASSENIEIGTPVAGIVRELFVDVGSKVQEGTPLFRIDDRELQAQLLVQQAMVKSAEQAVKVAEATLADDRNKWQLWEQIKDQQAVSREELDSRRFAVDKAEASAAKARADVESARAMAAQVQTEIDRRVVKSPIAGQVLQMKLHVGEFAPAGAVSQPLMVVGATQTLHVRTDIDENDAWRLSPDAGAVAHVRGNSAMKSPLKLVRIEPYVVPKRSLTGDATERVDTRVLQVLYSFNAADLPVYVGQQMDVYIEDLRSGLAATMPAGVR